MWWVWNIQNLHCRDAIIWRLYGGDEGYVERPARPEGERRTSGDRRGGNGNGNFRPRNNGGENPQA